MARNRRPFLGLGVVLAATVLLSACGNRFQAPAATVDGRDITQEALKTELDLALADPQLAQQVAGPEGNAAKANLTRQALAALIQNELAGEYAEAHGIVVTGADIDAALRDVVTQVGGQAQFDQLIRARGLTVPRVRQILQQQVLLQRIRDDLTAGPGPALSPQEQDFAFQRWLSDRVAHARISVNPRFGRFDPKTGEVVPITSTADLG